MEDVADIPTVHRAKRAFMLRIGERPGGWPLAIPILIASGSDDGPTLVVCGALHGGGILGSAVITQAWRDLDVGTLHGTYIGLPMANPPAVETRTRNNVMETYPGPVDMNRCFPGNAAGTASERIAAAIASRFLGNGQFVLDLHTVARGGEWLPYASVPRGQPAVMEGNDGSISDRSRQLGLAFGADLVIEQPPHPGSLVDAALRAGSPAVSVEFGIADRLTRDDVSRGLAGVSRVLAHVGVASTMVSAPPPPKPMIVNELCRVVTSRGGYLDLSVELGEFVRSGQPVGAVLDIEGEAVEYLVAPADGWISRVSTMGSVGTGEVALVVGRGRGTI